MVKVKDESPDVLLAHARSAHPTPARPGIDLHNPCRWGEGGVQENRIRSWWLLALEMDPGHPCTISAFVGLKLLQSADKTTKKKRKERIVCVNFISRTQSISHIHSCGGLELLAWF